MVNLMTLPPSICTELLKSESEINQTVQPRVSVLLLSLSLSISTLSRLPHQTLATHSTLIHASFITALHTAQPDLKHLQLLSTLASASKIYVFSGIKAKFTVYDLASTPLSRTSEIHTHYPYMNSVATHGYKEQEVSSTADSKIIISSSSTNPSNNLSRYENQKRRDWNTFIQYLQNHRPPLSLARCSGAHVLEYLRYLDQFGKTKVHLTHCPFYGYPNPPAPCPCPLRQAWGSLDSLIGRLRAAYEENGGQAEANPFGAVAVRLHLREVRESQARARGVSYDKKKRKRPVVAERLPDEETTELSIGPPQGHHLP